MQVHDLTAGEARREMEAGRLTAVAYLESLLGRIAEREEAVGAFETLDAERALARAASLDRGPARGALHGIPFGAKDIIDSADFPTRLGSPIFAGNQPMSDAACIAMPEAAGGILIGKTVTTEFGNVHPGRTRNPFDPARTPGGSSSGSAAAVGDRMVPLAIGTQTTASTIRPASFCGVFGFVPSYGDVSLSGVRQASGSLDRLGLFARSAEDINLFRRTIQGRAPAPLGEVDGALRIGFCKTHLWDGLDPSTQAFLEHAATQISAAGARVTEAVLPPDFADLVEAHRRISSFE
ncbi:MAG TPA: amidase, partial [Methyloceanibacter sp.]|nr:amidase [Methyloceanibacter sp.]